MDQATQLFFFKIFSILGLEGDRDELLQTIYQNSLHFAIKKSYEKMSEEKRQVLSISLQHAHSFTQQDRIYRQFVNPAEYAESLFLGSQYAFEDFLKKRGKAFSPAEKQALLALIPQDTKKITQRLQKRSHPSVISERRRG